MQWKSKYKDLSKNTILFMINSFGSKIISFLLVPLYTYVLSTKDYGTADLITSMVQLLVPVLTLNIQDAVLRFSLDKEYDKKDVISIGIKHNFIGLILLLLGSIAARMLGVLLLNNTYMYFLIVSFILNGLHNSFSMYLKANDKVYVLVISGIANTLFVCVLNIFLLVTFKLGITGYLIANVAGIVMAVSIMFICGGIYKNLRLETEKKLNQAMIGYALPLVMNSVAWWINNASDKYILTFFCGFAVNGIFSVAYKIPTILSTIQSVFYNSWSVSAITEFDENDSDGFMGNIYTLYSCVSILGCSAIMLLNYPLASILYAKDFFEAWHYVPLLLLGATFNGIALFEGCIFTAVKKTKEVFRTTLIGAVVNTIANILFIWLIGPFGAAIATMLGYFTVWLLRTIHLRSIVKMKVNWKTQIITTIILSAQCVVALNQGFEAIEAICLMLICVFQYSYIKKF
ncbi:multidrug transporter [bacterium 1xD8-6]|nr:multidrug transporter [bacterium D16-36]RKI72393.1 multidrug transporter [bacterium 1xD8-6]